MGTVVAVVVVWLVLQGCLPALRMVGDGALPLLDADDQTVIATLNRFQWIHLILTQWVHDPTETSCGIDKWMNIIIVLIGRNTDML